MFLSHNNSFKYFTSSKNVMTTEEQQKTTAEEYQKAVEKTAMELGISPYDFTLDAIGSNTQPNRLKSAEIRFKDDSLEAIKKNMELLAENGAKMVDFNPLVGGFLVYGSPRCLLSLQKSDEVKKLSLIYGEHNSTKM